MLEWYNNETINRAKQYSKSCKEVTFCCECKMNYKECEKELGGLIPSIHSINTIAKTLHRIKKEGTK